MKKALKIILIFALCILLTLAGALFFIFTESWIDLSSLEHYNPGKASIVLDDSDNELMRFELDKREPVALHTLPQHLIHAFIATEDHDFFSHQGISARGVIRSICVNLYNLRIVQGASTITQQLAKLLFFDTQRTFKRKIKEQLLALVIEQQFTKEQILETYLNHIYFGCGIYGIEAASQRFWGIHAKDLDIAQSATLAGIVRSPGRYCPLIAPENSKARRNLVLSLMNNLGYIDTTIREYERDKDLGIIPMRHSSARHAKEFLRQILEDLVGRKTLYTSGLTIKTTFSAPTQCAAEQAFEKNIKKLRSSLTPDIDGGLVSIDPRNGAIKALIGGFDFKQSHFNRATQAYRQMGSVFKPLIYAAALKQGLSLQDVEIDEPLTLTNNGISWSPRNNTKKFDGPMTRAHALSRSNNIVAIKTLLQTGIDNVIDLAQRAHLPGPFIPYPSLALGCTDCTPEHAAAMFQIFANGGIYHKPYLIEWVKDQWGKKIFRHTPHQERVISWNIASHIAQALAIAPKKLANRLREKWLDSDVIIKTGTTNDCRTFFLTASTPELTTALYLGRDDNKAIAGNLLSVHTTLPLWQTFMQHIPTQQKRFNFDPALKSVKVDPRTGQETQDNDAHAIELFEE